MEYKIYAKNLLTDNEWEGDKIIKTENGIIKEISEGNPDNADFVFEYVSPALIDNHIHGGDGFDITNPSSAGLEKWLSDLAKAGVGGVVVSPYGEVEEIRKSLETIKNVMTRQKKDEIGGARLFGAHLEGPFISKDRPGSFREEVLLPPSVETFKKIADGFEDAVIEMTVAPELDGASELIKYLKDKDIRLLAGHTDCTYDGAMQAFSDGIGAICHTFNAIRPIHHREPGVVSAALVTEDIYCEMIGDLEHLHPGTLRLIAKCKGENRTMLISDAVSTTNLPDGIYEEAGVVVEVKNGVSRVKDDGNLNGGGCYISKSVKNLVDIGFDFKDALMAASINPARWLETDVLPKVGDSVFLEGWTKDFEPQKIFLQNKIYDCNI